MFTLLLYGLIFVAINILNPCFRIDIVHDKLSEETVSISYMIVHVFIIRLLLMVALSYHGV